MPRKKKVKKCCICSMSLYNRASHARFCLVCAEERKKVSMRKFMKIRAKNGKWTNTNIGL
jgi:hypothetical protein